MNTIRVTRGRGAIRTTERHVSELYNDSDELANSLAAIEALAQETKRPVAEVKQVYEVELARLKSDARITDYLLLFASRRTRTRLSRVAH